MPQRRVITSGYKAKPPKHPVEKDKRCIIGGERAAAGKTRVHWIRLPSMVYNRTLTLP